MDPHPSSALTAAARLRDDLRTLGAALPPASLRPAVLVRVGLADGYWVEPTPIGPVFVAFNEAGVSAVAPAADADAFETATAARLGRPVYPVAAPPPYPPRQRRRRLSGEGGSGAGLPRVDWRGCSPFERAVLAAALTIPRGQVRPYAWIAREIGRPGASRAVGSALGRNPVPVLVPCHRVVRGDGRVGDYVFGGEAKRALLAAEGVPPARLAALARSGVRYNGSDTTGIFCYPTCHHARRTAERHLVAFASATAAAAAGYRPCKVCRPPLAA